MKKILNKRSYVILGITFLYLCVRLPYLGYDTLNSDGGRWYRRSENFLSALKSGDLSSTYQHYQPGVTLMWINAVTRQADWFLQDFSGTDRHSLENASDFLQIHQISKTVLVLVLTSLFILQLVLIYKLYGVSILVFFGILVSFEPYLAGLDRWFHLTALENMLSFTAILSLLMYLKSQKISYVLGSGVLFGLSLLTKSSALLSLVFGVLLLLTIWVKRRNRYTLKPVILLLFFSLTTFIVLFPALWVSFSDVVVKIINAAGGAIDSTDQPSTTYGLVSAFYYLYILLYKLTPATVLLIIFSVVYSIRVIVKDRDFGIGVAFSYLLFLLVTYSLPEKHIDRYSYAFILPLLLLISFFLSSLKVRAVKYIFIVYLATICIAYYSIYPVFTAYYSTILGGASNALKLGIFDTSGEYMLQASEYLNARYGDDSRPEVFVPDDYDPAYFTYKGKTVREIDDYSGLNDSKKYVIRKLDADRDLVDDSVCNNISSSFGPRLDIPYVYIMACN